MLCASVQDEGDVVSKLQKMSLPLHHLTVRAIQEAYGQDDGPEA